MTASNTGELTILSVDSEKIFSTAFKQLIISQVPTARVVIATNGVVAHSLIETKEFDIVFLAFNTYDIHGLHLLTKVGQKGLKTIALTHLKGKALLMETIRCGIHGYINKDDEPDELFSCIQSVASGVKYFNPMAREVAFSHTKYMGDPPKLVLSVRDIQILVLMSTGYTSSEIAFRLGSTKRGIESARDEMMTKTKTSNAVDLMMFCLENGVVTQKLVDQSRSLLESLDLSPLSDTTFENAARAVRSKSSELQGYFAK